MTRTRGMLCAAFGVGLSLAGCADWSADPTPPPPAPPLSSAFDGRYSVAVRNVGNAAGINAGDCAVRPQAEFDVRDGRFNFKLEFYRLLEAAPTARDIAFPAYDVTITQDGTVSGVSEDGGTLTGRAEGQRITANIYGLLCYFSLTADRR